MRRTLACLLTLLTLFGSAETLLALDFSRIPLANGFDIPVGQNGKSYYKARGVRPNGHLGEDWNGAGGGDTDLGDPIYATADGIVVFCQDYRMGWGNVVIIRHAYLEGGEIKYVDSLYGHLLDFNVSLGQVVKRGQQIARMGNNHGMYDAHLHFEMRKNITVGMYRSSFPRDYSVYWDPTNFVADHRTLPGDSRMVQVPINTFAATPPPVIAGVRLDTPSQTVTRAGLSVVGNTLISRAQGQLSRSSAPSTLTRSLPPVAAVNVPAAPIKRTAPELATPTPKSATLPKTGSGAKVATAPKATPKAASPTKNSSPAKSATPPEGESGRPPEIAAAPPANYPSSASVSPPPAKRDTPVRRPEFRVNRFEDMRSLGYE